MSARKKDQWATVGGDMFKDAPRAVVKTIGLNEARAERLREWRDSIVLSRADVALVAGISAKTIDRVEHGERVKPMMLKRILYALLQLDDRMNGRWVKA